MSEELTDLNKRLEAKRLSMVFSAESGSRAWGFASKNSDYDVRFIFSKQLDGYLSLHGGLEDIQYKKGELDYAGWDLRKSLILAAKSNPSLIEWLGSPIVYADPIGFGSDLRAIMAEHHSPRALVHHYVNFMRNIRGKYLSDFMGEYTMKKYFYALRPIFCVMWMQDHPGKLPPTVFTDMLALPIHHEIKREIQKLLVLKIEAAAEETDFKSEVLDKFIAEWFDKGHEVADSFPAREVPFGLLDEFFRNTLKKLGAGWSSGSSLGSYPKGRQFESVTRVQILSEP